MKIVKKLIPALVFTGLALLPTGAFAQDPGCSPDSPCPIDNGTIVLIGTVMLIAGKKAYDSRKRKATVEI